MPAFGIHVRVCSKVKMPAGNRMATSASLNTHSIWQNAIGYDPYAAESSGADTGANEQAAANARENMKALMALANKNKATLEDEKGGWRGRGTLRGGWTAGKDLGEVPKEELLSAKGSGSGAAAADDMPSSTSSLTSDDDDNDAPGGGGGGSSSAVSGGESKKRAREDDERAEKKKRKHRSSKHDKEKRHKHRHKHKSDKDKKKHKHKHKSDKDKKRHNHSSSSD